MNEILCVLKYIHKSNNKCKYCVAITRVSCIIRLSRYDYGICIMNVFDGKQTDVENCLRKLCSNFSMHENNTHLYVQ